MLSQAAILLLAVTTVGINAFQLAKIIPRDLIARTVNAPGGWALAQSETDTCPSGNPVCGASWCCPNSLACVHTGTEDIAEVCCPTDTDCSETFTTTPECADSSWSLWNATFDTSDTAGYFCCLSGQIGLQDGNCAEANTPYATSGPQAIPIAPGTATSSTQPATSASSTPNSSAATRSATTTIAALLPSTTKIASNAISTSTIIANTVSTNSAATESATPTSGTPTSVASTTPAGTSSSPVAINTVAATTAKGEAVGFSLVGGTLLGGALIAMFAVALL